MELHKESESPKKYDNQKFAMNHKLKKFNTDLMISKNEIYKKSTTMYGTSSISFENQHACNIVNNPTNS